MDIFETADAARHRLARLDAAALRQVLATEAGVTELARLWEQLQPFVVLHEVERQPVPPSDLRFMYEMTRALLHALTVEVAVREVAVRERGAP